MSPGQPFYMLVTRSESKEMEYLYTIAKKMSGYGINANLKVSHWHDEKSRERQHENFFDGSSEV